MSITKTELRQIIALGGGGFSDEPDNPLLDEYILKSSGKPEPKILFLPAAGGDNEEYISKFYNSYTRLECESNHLALSKQDLSYSEIESIILSQDIIFIGGGSTKSLMNVLKEKRADEILIKAWEQGIVLSGMSAGAICWFIDGFTNPRDNVFVRLYCIGLLKGSFCPHYSSAAGLKEIYAKMILNKELSGGFGVDDGAALHFNGTKLMKVVSSRPEARVYRLTRGFGKVKQKIIIPGFLGN